MRVFLDTEFTNFNLPELISLGLVTEDGREFYAERTDFSREACSAFVHAHVLPLLGRLPGAACDAGTLGERLHGWLEALGEPVCMVYDYADDWLLLTQTLISEERLRLPTTLQSREFVWADTLHHPAFREAHAAVYSLEWMPHHALADARSLRAGVLAWEAVARKSR